jgi:hypothetical protein
MNPGESIVPANRSLPPWPLALFLLGLCLAYVVGVGVFAWPAIARRAAPELEAATLPEYAPPRGYVCYRTATPLEIDGRLDKPAWQAVPWSEDFVDIEGDRKPRPRFRTRVKMLWDDRYLYIGAELEEPHVWATLTDHDSYIFTCDPDFEVFIDPNGDSHEYFEFEINALNTSWDLLLTKPYKDGGKPVDSWNIPGLKTAIHVDGTLNDPKDTDHGWSIEIAFPWKVLGELAYRPHPPGESTKQAVPPKEGDQWRIDFSRVEWEFEITDGKYHIKPGVRENNWVWSPQGVIDMHRPETWGYVQFSAMPVGQAVFEPDPAGSVKHLLHVIYYQQRKFREDKGRWARTLDELELHGIDRADKAISSMTLETTSSAYQVNAEVRLPNGKTRVWHIRNDALVWSDN